MADKGIIKQHPAPVVVAEPPPAGVVPGPLEYPDSDGRFLPENPLQANAIVELRSNLKQHFRDRPDVVVEGDMFLYYEKGQADERLVRGKRVGKFVAPDVIVVLDHDLGGRGTYKLWEEGKPPDFALEVISPSSEVRNRETKRDLYERIGIGEYFVFQPDTRRAGPRLVGYELKKRGYERLGPQVGLPGSVRSDVLGVSLRPEGALLRLRDLRSGTDYLWNVEVIQEKEAEAAARQVAEAARREAEHKAQREAAARREAEHKAEREAAARRQEATARREAEHRAEREAAARREEAAARREAEHRAEREAVERKAVEARLAAFEARLGHGGQHPTDAG